MLKFVDISGFGHSGKSVITDLLKEFKGYQAPAHGSEFDLVRIQGGLLDLRTALMDDWSPIRSDAGIRRFRNIVFRTGHKATFTKPLSLFYANGMNYDAYFNHQFLPLSEKYIQSLISDEYASEWPYPIVEENWLKQFRQRMLGNMRIKKAFKRDIVVAAPHNFIAQTRQYLYELFSTIALPDTTCMVTLNALEPYNPTRGLDFFEQGRIIIVQRDPRDIFASTQVKDGVFIPQYETAKHWKLKESFLNTSDVAAFVKRQRIFLEQIKLQADDERVLRLRYEDIIQDYDNVVQRVLQFLGEDASIHIHRKKHFDPEQSSRNVGIWRRFSNQETINYIYRELSEFCYQ